MMIRLDSQTSDVFPGPFRDEDTEIEPLGLCVGSDAANVTSRGGQTRLTCVESESTDDE